MVSVLDFTRIEESWRHKRSMTMALGRCHAQGQPSRRHCGNLAKYWKVAVVVTFLTQNICSQPVLRKDGQIFACVCNPTYQIGVLLCCLGVWEGGSLAKLHGCPVELRDIEFYCKSTSLVFKSENELHWRESTKSQAWKDSGLKQPPGHWLVKLAYLKTIVWTGEGGILLKPNRSSKYSETSYGQWFGVVGRQKHGCPKKGNW